MASMLRCNALSARCLRRSSCASMKVAITRAASNKPIVRDSFGTDTLQMLEEQSAQPVVGGARDEIGLVPGLARLVGRAHEGSAHVPVLADGYRSRQRPVQDPVRSLSH